MFKRRFRSIFITLLLLAFAGQAVASTRVHCRMAMNGGVSQELSKKQPSDMQLNRMDHALMMHDSGHSLHLKSTQNKKSTESQMKHLGDSSRANCCSLAGDCSYSSCGTISMVSATAEFARMAVSQNMFSLSPLAISQSVNPLYRPPIFA